MHQIKNGVKSALRTPFKTILFTLLLTLTAALVSASLSVFTAVRAYLSDCGEYFHTIARLEYVGRDYPSETVFDPAFSAAAEASRGDIEALIGSGCVLSFSPSKSYLAYSPAVSIRDDTVYDPESAVLKLIVMNFDDHTGVFTATVSECLYSKKDLTDKIVYFRTDGTPPRVCYAVGRFIGGPGATPVFVPQSTAFFDGGIEKELPAFSDASDAELEELFFRCAELIRIKNDSCRAYYTASVEDEPLFHQQSVTLRDGRLFTDEEYSSRGRSVLISERYARLVGLEVGSAIRLEIYGSDGDVYDTGRDLAVDSGDYEVVGIFREGDSFPWTVFLPDANAAGSGLAPSNGYTVGVFRLDNGSVSEFQRLAAPLLENGFRLTVFDQGYSAAAEPMKELDLISVIFLAVSVTLAAAALILQSFLFVSRQRETAVVMRDLGSGKAGVYSYYLSSALLIAAAAAAAGCVACRLAEGRITDLLKRFAEQFSGEDLTFSDSRLAAIRTLAFDPVIPFSTYLISALSIAAGSGLTTAVFTAFVLKKPKNKRRKRLPARRAGRTSRLSGFFKYGVLSVRRGFMRSLAVLLLCAAAGLFFGRVTDSLSGYAEQLEVYKEGAKISGYATDITGSRLDGVIVRGTAIERLIRSGEADEFSVTDDLGHVRPLGVTVSADGTEHEAPYTLPEQGNQLESLFTRIENTARWSVCSSLEETPMYHFTEARRIEWLEGFDDRIFLGSSNACAMPLALMEEYGVSLGDTVRFEYASYLDKNGLMFYYVNELKVVAGYSSAQNVCTVFCPIGYRPPHADMGWSLRLPLKAFNVVIGYTFMEEKSFGMGIVSRIPRFYTEPDMDKVSAYSRFDPEAFLNGSFDPDRNYRSFIFASHDAGRLPELRRALAEGFTFVGSEDRSKGFAVIEDEIYLNTVRSMTRQIQYVTAFSYALFALAWITGFVLAWLMTLSRRKEIAVMRALGTPPLRITLNFFFEQAALALAGVVIGALISRLSGAEPSLTQFFFTVGFFLLWCVSALLSLVLSLLKRARAALTEPE